ncbi:hypothetical protein DM02DRAFT_656247 [Periconia macrospinosa]|uniref:Uncharacterized protein n=1 Tax=Periconia macrospinosa TaxID=97972 RepID=A0A2V1DP26_9PLEO|nr:hypothetical protein DM02DRAFT_656247 [Periconia macrospinosa]
MARNTFSQGQLRRNLGVDADPLRSRARDTYKQRVATGFRSTTNWDAAVRKLEPEIMQAKLYNCPETQEEEGINTDIVRWARQTNPSWAETMSTKRVSKYTHQEVINNFRTSMELLHSVKKGAKAVFNATHNTNRMGEEPTNDRTTREGDAFYSIESAANTQQHRHTGHKLSNVPHCVARHTVWRDKRGVL